MSDFISSPTEAVKLGEPLSNSDAITKALEKGEIYKRGFEDARQRYERPTGKWRQNINGWHVCSSCQMEFIGMPTIDRKPRWRYCPMCGAKMEAEDETN